MNPLTQSKNTTILPVLIALTLGCFALSPQARAVEPAPDGGYPNQNTAEDDDALFSLTTGADNTAMGFDALDSNTTGSDNALASWIWRRAGTINTTCEGGAPHVENCKDSDACNGLETCSAGACLNGVPINSNDNDPCTADNCNPDSGLVTHTPVPEGTSCSDGQVCNGEELCLVTGGSCASVPSGAVSWWRGENNANDSVSMNHGTLAGGTTFQTFRFVNR